jgi:hypothetical protein
VGFVREGEFVLGKIRGRGLAGAIVAERGRWVIGGQAFQASLEIIRAHPGFVGMICLAGA